MGLSLSDYPAVPYKQFAGQPSVLRAIALDWSRDFNVDRVAAQFGTRATVVRKILARKEIQDYLSGRLLPMEQTVEAVRHRLFEEVTKEAFSAEPSKERSEARRMLSGNLLPEMKKVTHEHRFVIEAPPKAKSVEAWAAEHSQLPPVLEAEVIEDGTEIPEQYAGRPAPEVPAEAEEPGAGGSR
jgi:hypothetical protein